MSTNSPKETTLLFTSSAEHKAHMPIHKFMLIAFIGGCFIAFGGLLAVYVPAAMSTADPGLVKLMSGALFPVGLIMISICGVDLFTSDCAGMSFACLGKKISLLDLLKIFIVSYLLNFVGTQFISYFFANYAGVAQNSSTMAYLHKLVNTKMELSFGQCFVRGIAANWLVCIATWIGFSAKSISGKCIGIWLPIMVFVTLGFEHSIANMFYVPTAIYIGATDISWLDFFIKNLLPSTLGNIVGGAGFVGLAYWYLYMNDDKH